MNAAHLLTNIAVIHVLPLKEWEDGFKLSMSGEALKVLINP
jgi:hypothetical protein